jgi:hypothetical protein
MTGDADNSKIGKPLAQLNDFHRGGESGLVTGADFKSDFQALTLLFSSV